MHHFFVEKENFTDGRVCISGEDYNHAVNVLRLNTGERVLISDHDGRDFICLVEEKKETDGESGLWLKIEKEAEEIMSFRRRWCYFSVSQSPISWNS